MSISKTRGLGRSQGSTRVGRNVWRTIRSPAWEAVFYTIELNWNYYRQGRKGRSPFPAPPRKGRILRLDLTKHFSANTIFDGRCLLQADAYGPRKKCIPSFPPFLPSPPPLKKGLIFWLSQIWHQNYSHRQFGLWSVRLRALVVNSEPTKP